MAGPSVWAVHDGKVGMANQVIGLAEALGYPFIEKRLAIRGPWRHLTPQLWIQPLARAGSGRRSPGAALARRADRRRTAHHGAGAGGQARERRAHLLGAGAGPPLARREVDLIVAPAHDPATGDNVFRTLGAVHRITAGAPRRGCAPLWRRGSRRCRGRWWRCCWGAPTASTARGEALFAALVEQLVALAEAGHGLAITPSRRTGAANEALLRRRLAGLPAYIWDGTGDNPYFGLLGLADAVLVTANSVSMVSEAAATGKPVHVIDLEGGSAKFSRFHRALRDAGITRPFTGAIENWRYAPPEDTARAAAEIRRRLALRLPEVA